MGYASHPLTNKFIHLGFYKTLLRDKQQLLTKADMGIVKYSTLPTNAEIYEFLHFIGNAKELPK